MTKKHQESKLVATAITEGILLSLITPDGRYEIVDGRVMRAVPIQDYKAEVSSELDKIKQRATKNFYSGEYHIKVFGTAPEVELK